MQEINEKDFFINGKKEEIKEYQFFFEDGTSENCDFEESLKEKCYAYSMYSSITDNTKYFVKTKKGIIVDPNTNSKKKDYVFKSVNKACFDLYTTYLDPKKRSRFRLIEAQKNI